MQDDIRDTRNRNDKAEPRATETHLGPEHQLAPPKRSSGVRILVWVVILLLFALLFWWVMHHHQAPAAAGGGGRRGAASGGTVTLTTSTAKQGSIGVYLDAIGTVTPVYTTTIVSQVTGVISQVRYREGQLVRRGQPLIEIDPRPFQANVLAAQGALERDTNLLSQGEMDLKRYQATGVLDADGLLHLVDRTARRAARRVRAMAERAGRPHRLYPARRHGRRGCGATRPARFPSSGCPSRRPCRRFATPSASLRCGGSWRRTPTRESSATSGRTARWWFRRSCPRYGTC